MTSYRFEQIAQQLRGDAAADDKTVDLLSMSRAADRAVSYIILEAEADHARLRSHSDLDSTASVDQRLDGDEDFVHEAAGGGLSHPRHANRTEETWKRNAALFAAALDALVTARHVDFVIVTGDPHVVELVRFALSEKSRQMLTALALDTLAPGSSQDAVTKLIDTETARVLGARRSTAVNGLLAETEIQRRIGVDAVVAELQEASVSTLFVDEHALSDFTLYALDNRPWISDSAEPGLVPLPMSFPAADVLVRAAILTGSDIIFAPAGSLPENAAVAATTRWLPDGQRPIPEHDPNNTAEVTTPKPMEPQSHLTSHHRSTLQHILQHPSSNNVTWQDALSLLDEAGTVSIGRNGEITLTLGDETESFDPGTRKDLDVDNLVDLRRMLAGAGFAGR